MEKAFSCKQCGDCCKGRGGIWTTNKKEIEAISCYLNITPEVFIKRYCEAKNGHYYIKEKEIEGQAVCIFLKKNGDCAIHPCKPLPCRLWPFWKAILKSEIEWRIAMNVCPGINPKVSFAQFVKEGEIYRQRILGNQVDERKHL